MSAGIRAGSSNDGYVQVNGNDIITALSGGNVGIGNTSPSTKLHVNGTITATNFVGNVGGTPEFSGDLTIPQWIIHAGDTDTKLGFPSADAVDIFAGGKQVRLTSDGHLGINRTTPAAPITARRLDAGGSNTAGVIAEFANSSGYGVWFGQSSASGAAWGSTTGDFYWCTNGLSSQVERLRINSTGKVTVKSNAANSVAIALVDNDSTNEIWRVGQAADGDGYVEVLEDGGTVGCKLDASGNSFTMGNFGIGDASPSQLLTISHAANTTNGILIKNTNNSQGSAIAQLELSGGDNSHGRVQFECNGKYATIRHDGNGHLGFYTNGSNERLRIKDSGEVLIGGYTTFSSYTKLQVRGATSAISDGGQIFDVASTAAATGGTRLAFGVNEDSYTWIRSYESSVGARDMVFATNNEKLRITSDGHLKILGQGQTTGFYLTNSYGQAGIFGGMYFNGSSWVRDAHASRLGAGMYINTGGHIAFVRAAENSGTTATMVETARFTSGGCFSIGTASPNQASVPGIHIESDEADDCRIAFVTTNKANTRIGYYGLSNRFGMDVHNGFQIRDAGSSYATRILIDSSGDVGIGTDNSTNRVTISSGSSANAVSIRNTTGGNGNVGILFSTQDHPGGREKAAIYHQETHGQAHYGGDFIFCLNTATGGATQVSASDERMRITRHGWVFLGKSSNAVNTTGVELSSNGNNTFTRNGNTVATFNRGTNNGAVVSLMRSGNEGGTINITPSSCTYNSGSDYRRKENDVVISDGITKLKQLRPIRFNFKDEPDKTVDGFFAHEVQTVIPEIVTGTKDAVVTQDDIDDGDYKQSQKDDPKYQSMDYSKLTPLLTAALKEAIAKIETLEAKVTALESS